MIETFTEAVERLKKNEKAFLLLPKEDREILRNVGADNCRWLNDDGNWMELFRKESKDPFWNRLTYRIRSDYQPEPEKPEDIDREVYEDCGNNLIVECLDGIARFIDEVVHRPDFRGFFLESDDEVSLGWVARRMAKGKKVVARFERK